MNKKPALVFDVNETLLDMEPLHGALTEQLGFSDDQVGLWFRTLLHYSLVDTARGVYHDFGQIGAATLMMTASSTGKALGYGQAKEILSVMKQLPPHPDVKPGLTQLKEKGYALYAFSNGGTESLGAQLAHATLSPLFTQILSVEKVRAYKPFAKAYEYAIGQTNMPPTACVMVAAHGWDIAGAARAGMRTAFIRRQGKELYPLGASPDYDCGNLLELAGALE